MHPQPNAARATGHVRLIEKKRGAVWYARIRRPDGSQITRRIGLHWAKRGRPADGYYTRQGAEKALLEMLSAVEQEAGKVKAPSVTFGQAADEWLRYVEHDKGCSASTLRDYRATAARLRDAIGADTALEDVTPQDVEDYRVSLTEGGKKLAARTINRHTTILGGIFRRAAKRWGTTCNPVARVDKLREPRYGSDLRYLRPEEVQAVVREATSRQWGAVFLTAALTGLRLGELAALRWQDVDFGIERVHVRRSFCWESKKMKSPKSRQARSVPMAPEVVVTLDALSKRDRFTGPDDLVFPEWDGGVIYHGEWRAALYTAMRAAGLGHMLDRPAGERFRFHDLRHTFGTLTAQVMPLTAVQALMGHAHINTTMIYAHYAPGADEGAKISAAFNAGMPTAVATVAA